MKAKPTIEQLNNAQDEWMKLASDAPKEETNRVIKPYNAVVPKAYLNVTPDKAMAGLMIDGAPMWAERRPLAEALAFVRNFNANMFRERPPIREDIAWCGHEGKWVNL